MNKSNVKNLLKVLKEEQDRIKRENLNEAGIGMAILFVENSKNLKRYNSLETLQKDLESMFLDYSLNFK